MSGNARYWEASGNLAEIMFQKTAQAFPAGDPACGRAGFIFRSNGVVAKRLMMISQSPLKDLALANGELLQEVVRFKQHFYPCTWANYELAKPPTIRLLPEDGKLSGLRQDCTAMTEMFFLKHPSFFDLLSGLKRLEREINSAFLTSRH